LHFEGMAGRGDEERRQGGEAGQTSSARVHEAPEKTGPEPGAGWRGTADGGLQSKIVAVGRIAEKRHRRATSAAAKLAIVGDFSPSPLDVRAFASTPSTR